MIMGRVDDFLRNTAAMPDYQKTREAIHHDGSKPPKLGTYTPPPRYLVLRLVVKRHNNDT